MTLVVTLLVRDETDILAAMLEHHLAAGADHVIVTDNASGDEGRELLARYARTGRVTVIHEPATTYQQDVWVTRMARLAVTEHGADWVINADADEFYWPLGPDGEPVAGPRIGLPAALAAIPAGDGLIHARRDNLVADPAATGTWPHRLRLRDTLALSERGTRIRGKAIHRGDATVEVAFGNHEATGPGLGPPSALVPLIVLHAPDRSYEQFAGKIAKGGSAVASNPDLPPPISWHWRADHQRLLDGTLPEVWQSRQLTRDRADAGLAEGTLLPEDRLLHRLLWLRERTVIPGILDELLAGAAERGTRRPSRVPGVLRTVARRIGMGPAAALAATAAPREPFSVAVIPDTQTLVVGNPDGIRAQAAWIAAHRVEERIAFAAHLGDVVEHHHAVDEFALAAEALAVLGDLPLVLSSGNHDLIDYSGGSGRWLGAGRLTEHFPLPTGRPGWGGSFAGQIDNAFWLLTAGGVDLLVLSLEFGPRDEVLVWANAVAAAHPERFGIVVTHDFLGDDGRVRGSRAGAGSGPPEHALPGGPGGTPMPGANTGAGMWEKFLRHHPGLRLILSGHVVAGERVGPSGAVEPVPGKCWTAARARLVRDDGSVLWAIESNYQHTPTAWMRLMAIDPVAGTIAVRTLDPVTGQQLTDDDHRFVIAEPGLFAG